MDNFYVTLPSSVQDYQTKNTSSQYVTRLPQVLNLERDKWVVALSDIIYPYSYVNVGQPLSYWIHFKDEKPVHVTFPSAQYSSLEEIVSKLNNETATRMKRSAVEDELGGKKESIAAKKIRINKQRKEAEKELGVVNQGAAATTEANIAKSNSVRKGKEEQAQANINKHMAVRAGRKKFEEEAQKRIDKIKSHITLEEEDVAIPAAETIHFEPPTPTQEHLNETKADEKLTADAILKTPTEKPKILIKPKDLDSIQTPQVNGGTVVKEPAKHLEGSSTIERFIDPPVTQTMDMEAAKAQERINKIKAIQKQAASEERVTQPIIEEAKILKPSGHDSATISNPKKDDSTVIHTPQPEASVIGSLPVETFTTPPNDVIDVEAAKAQERIDKIKSIQSAAKLAAFKRIENVSKIAKEAKAAKSAVRENVLAVKKNREGYIIRKTMEVRTKNQQDKETMIDYLENKELVYNRSPNDSEYAGAKNSLTKYRNMENIVTKVSNARDFLKFSLHNGKIHIEFLQPDRVLFVEFDKPCAYFLGFTDTIIRHSSTAEKKVDFFGNVSALYLYCDCVEPNLIGNELAPLLSIIPCSGQYGDMIRHTITHPRYYPIMNSTIDSIKIQLLSEFAEPVDFNWGTTIVVLHFKKFK